MCHNLNQMKKWISITYTTLLVDGIWIVLLFFYQIILLHKYTNKIVSLSDEWSITETRNSSELCLPCGKLFHSSGYNDQHGRPDTVYFEARHQLCWGLHSWEHEQWDIHLFSFFFNEICHNMIVTNTLEYFI